MNCNTTHYRANSSSVPGDPTEGLADVVVIHALDPGDASAIMADGVDARLDVWTGMPQGFVAGIGTLKASAQALDAIGMFLADSFRGRQ